MDVALWGHMHCMEVVAPVSNGTVEPGVVAKVSTNPETWVVTNASWTSHLTVGTLGAVIAEAFKMPQPSWSLYRLGALIDDAYGYVVLRANRTELSFQFLQQSTGKILWEIIYRK